MWIKGLSAFGVVALLVILTKGFKGLLAVLAIIGAALITSLALWTLGFIFILMITKSFKEAWGALKPSELFKDINRMEQ
jgi:hypothetical protein